MNIEIITEQALNRISVIPAGSAGIQITGM
jgi:hypothetical protein